MRVRDVLAAVTAAILDQRRVLELGPKTYNLVPMPGGAWSLSLPKMTVESVLPTERTLCGQAVRNFGKVVLRVRVKNEKTGHFDLVDYGAIDGRYVENVDEAVTRMLFVSTVL